MLIGDHSATMGDPLMGRQNAAAALRLVAEAARPYLDALPTLPVRDAAHAHLPRDLDGPLPEDGEGAPAAVAELRWLRELVGLPGTFGGVLTPSATFANLTGLACARHWWAARHGVDVTAPIRSRRTRISGSTCPTRAVALRPAIVNWRTTEADVDLLVSVVREIGARLAGQ
ncbi:hypothetical protein GCM10010492_07060 [Saccharothrix mutabilis subsp. mutabilis]|uniref:Uncharacterized protein n=2 Tax=Saccharothrix mutabilis TaxID=33921 RepID=A0ABN0T451_9PSEU